MKKLFAVLTLLIGFQANAGLITIETDQDNIQIGDSVIVTLIASGMDSFDYFDLDFLFNTNMYTFDENSLISDLPLLDELFLGEGLSATSINGSGLFFSFYQWDEVVGSGVDLVLASFELTAIGTGQNIFSFDSDFTYFAGINGEISVNTDLVSNSDVISASTSVPEPSTLIVFALGLMGLVSCRINKQA